MNNWRGFVLGLSVLLCVGGSVVSAAADNQPLTDEQLYQQFVEPGPAYRGKPFWSWNGKLEKDELMRQIQVIKEMGFGGLLHAFAHRSGDGVLGR